MINKKKNNKGFTLVELLVVIAIIGILAVVAVPALFKNINKSKVADLQSDYSAIKSAVLSYYTDNNKLPAVPGNLANDMDSVPVKSALGEGQYTFENNTTDKVFYLCVGDKTLKKDTNKNGICDDEDEDLNGNKDGIAHDCNSNTCYEAAKGITITTEQLEKLVSDLGSGMVSIKSTTDSTFKEDSGVGAFIGSDGKVLSTAVGEGKVLRIKLISNTDM